MELASASAFAEEGFDAREWVEAVLASASAAASSDASTSGGQGGGGVEGVVSSVSMRLQLLAQELNGELEKGLLDLVASFPRAMAELDKLDLSAQDLRSGLAQVLGGVNEAGKRTASSVKDEGVVGKEEQEDAGPGPEQEQQGERGDEEDPVAVLARLHQVKARMAACRSTLQEAARWHQLVREANAGFANGELGLLASVLGQMRASLPVLAHMPEAEDRRRTLLRFEEELQALLKPQVASAMNKEAIGALQELALLYRKLGTSSALHAEYARARPAPLHRAWFAFHPAQDTFPQWLPGFYKRVGEVWAEERRRCKEVFGPEEAPAVLARLMVETFTPLAESYHQRLLLKPNDDAAADAGEDALPFPTVVSLFVQTTDFLAAACSAAHLSPFPLSPSPLTSNDPDDPSGMITPSVLAPYVPLLDAYEAREAAALQAWLLQAKARMNDSSAQEEEGALSAFAESVLDDATAAFPVATALAARSLRFSHGYHARQLLSLLDQFLTGDASRLAHAVRLARRRCGLVGGRGPSPVPPLAGQEAVTTAAPTVSTGAFDWDDLQGALRLLQAAGRHAAALRALEKEVAAVLAQMHDVLFGGASGAFSASLRDQNLHTASSNTTTPTPDAIALHWARDRLLSDQTRAAETRAFLRAVVAAGGGGGGSGGVGASGPPIPLPGELLKGPTRASLSLAGEAHRLLFDLCMQPVRSRTRTMAALAVWSQQASASSGGDAAGGGGDAFYSSLPQPYITQVGEHILSLIQQLEDFAASDALAEVAPVAPPGVIERLAEPEWRAAAVALGLNEAETASLLGAFHIASSSSQDTTTEGEEDREELALRFCNGWLLAVARAAAAALVGGACAVPGLTAAGARQMHTDAAYLLTVLQNLEVPPPPLLEALRDMCGWLQEEEGDGGLARVLRVADGEEGSEGEGEAIMGQRAARRRLARRLAAAWASEGGAF